MNDAASVRRLQPVRSRTHAPRGIRPCSASHASSRSGVSRKSGSRATSPVTSITHAGPMNRDAGIVSQALSGRSFPVIQWMGASKCVPVCSPIRIVFQYQAGPLSSYFEMTSIVTPGDGANIGGRPITGVDGPSGCVKSTTFSVPRFSSSTSCGQHTASSEMPRCLPRSMLPCRRSTA